MSNVFTQRLKEVECLMWYDGPLLVHYRDGKQDYVAVIADFVGNIDHWHVIKVEEHDMKSYMKNKVTLLQLMERSPAIYHCVGNWLNAGVAVGDPIPFASIPSDRRPSAKSFLRTK
jgi:hypothetical protein